MQPASIVEILQQRAVDQEERPLYTWLDDNGQEVEKWTVADLHTRAVAIARQLLALAKPGDRALLIYPPGLEFTAAFFGCLYAKIIAVPANMPRRRRQDDRLRAIAIDSSPTLLLTTGRVLDQKELLVAHNQPLAGLTWLATDQRYSEPAGKWRPPAIKGEDIAFLQYTSGSTAEPKGVIITHANLLVTQQIVAGINGMDSSSVYVSWLPLFHDLGLMAALMAAAYPGCPLVLMAPTAFLQKPILWLEAVRRYQCSYLAAPNFAFDLCVQRISEEERAGLDLTSLKGILNGAEPVRASTLQRFTATFERAGVHLEMFAPTYGLAEAVVYVTGAADQNRPLIHYFSARGLAMGQAIPVSPTGNDVQALTRSGAAAKDTGVLIVDPESYLLKEDGQIGEIWVAGPQVSPGYWNQPELTNATFQAFISGTGEGPYLRTGDLGFIHEGQLFISGRMKEMIIIRGKNYFPQDIEFTVGMSHPVLNMGGGAAFGLDTGQEELLVVAHEVKRDKRHNLDVEEITGRVRQAIAREYELTLDGLLLVRPQGIPKTTSGKTRRLETRKAFLAGTLPLLDQWLSEKLTGREEAAATEEPPVPAPFQLAKDKQANAGQIRMWIGWRLSALPGVGPGSLDLTRPFSDYGLDSLLTVQLVNELADWLHHELALAVLWELPNIEALISYLVESLARKDERSKTVDTSQPSLPVDAAEASRLLARIEGLNESEIDRLLTALQPADGAGLDENRENPDDG